MNSINLVGRLTRDVEIKISEKGTNIGRFTIAVDRPFAKEGQQQADFINCVAFEKVALNLSKYCSKGSQVSIEGKLQSFSYEKDGDTRFGMNVVANNIQFISHPVKYEDDKQDYTQNADEYKGEGIQIDEDDLPM